MKKLVALLLCIIGALNFLSSQPAKSPALIQQLDRLATYANQTPPEKIFVHTDKPYYTSGDTIWCKAYHLDGIYHTATQKSHSIYLELVDPKGNILVSRQLYSKTGGAAADLPIGSDWPTGHYLLRAYSDYMRNFGNEYFFKQIIPVYFQTAESAVNLSASDPSVASSPDKLGLPHRPIIRFFPEGGDLVEGLSSKVAFKVINQAGNSLQVEGWMENDLNDQQQKIATEQFGLGFLKVTPSSGSNDRVVLSLNGTEHSYALPAALPSGYTLAIKNRGKQLIVSLETNVPEGLKGAFLIGHQRGVPFIEWEGSDTDQSQHDLLVSTKTLESGIAHFTLFATDGEPLCERLVFIQNPDWEAEAVMESSDTVYSQRSLIEIDCRLKTDDDQKTIANASLSVVNADVVDWTGGTGDIRTWLLLNSDLPGHVEQAAYYFESPTDSRRRYLLDLVMLSHGWRRFSWQADQALSLKFPADQGLHIKGRTTKLDRPDKPVLAHTSLNFVSDGFAMYEQETTDDGYFDYGPFAFLDTVDLILQGRIPKKNKMKVNSGEMKGNRNVDIQIIDEKIAAPKIDFPDTTTRSEVIDIRPFLQLVKTQKQYDLKYDYKVIDLEETVITARRKTKADIVEEAIDKNTLYGLPTNRMIIDSIPGAHLAMSIFDLLRRVPGVMVSGAFPQETALIRGATSFVGSNTPLYLIDGVPVSEEMVQTMSVNDVYLIDVLKGATASIYGIRGGNGVIAIHTRNGVGSPAAYRRQPGIIHFKKTGYYKAREFYQPDYGDRKRKIAKPDLRITLYWQPFVSLTGKEDTTVQFYSGDQTGRFRVILQGITKSGKPFVSTASFHIK